MLPLNNSERCADKFREIWDTKLRYKEVTYVLYLDQKKHHLFHAELCAGRHSRTDFDLREAIQYAFNVHSDHIVIAHNHPSLLVEPSEQDIAYIRELKIILAALEIVLVDNIILTANEYYSFVDHNLLSSG